ncbi:MAG: hypothetical protein ACE5F2_00340 [Candidatus Paceibacteria bacterium]
MKAYKKGDIAKAVLKGLVLGGIVVAVVALPGMAPVLNLFGNDKRKKEKIRRTLKQLEKKRFVKMYYKDNKELVEITEKGKKRLLQYDYDDIKIKIPKRWDGLWRIVIFDVPENRKKARDSINIKLKELGFYSIQKSTFIFPYECKNEIDFIKEHLFVRKYVDYIVAKSIENEIKLKKIFNI